MVPPPWTTPTTLTVDHTRDPEIEGGWWRSHRRRRGRLGRAAGRRPSERGRGDNLIGYKGLGAAEARGTSVFCPVLTELMLRWFCPPGGAVLDPFAGGSVRGVVAARLGLRYYGVDLSREQVAENRTQAAAIEHPGLSRAAWKTRMEPEGVKGVLASGPKNFLFLSIPHGTHEQARLDGGRHGRT